MLYSNYARELQKVPTVGQFAQMLQVTSCVLAKGSHLMLEGVFLPPSSHLSWMLIYCAGEGLGVISSFLTQRDTTRDWHPPESTASCISCSKDRKFSKWGISLETLLLLASCILPLQSLSTSKSEQVQKERGLWQLPGKNKSLIVWNTRARLREHLDFHLQEISLELYLVA